jgi:hypothetical protein
MRKFYLYIAALSLILIGCSSTYKISNFSSKDKFYEDFNNFAKNKSVKVTLINDSSFSFKNGAEIANDTLFYLGKEIISGNKRIAVTDIKEINYIKNDYNSASILLMNGERFSAREIKKNNDSIEFAFTEEVITLTNVTSINRIKEIIYKNRWLGVIPGFIGGTLLGFVAGVTTVPEGTTSSGLMGQYNEPSYASVPIGTFSGLILGSAFGWFVGFNYTYQFNP